VAFPKNCLVQGLIYCCNIHPSVDSKRTSDVQICRIGYCDRTVHSVEAERLSYLACRECRSALQRAVVAVLNIVRVAIPWPPTHHVWWRRHAPWQWARRAQPRRSCSSNGVSYRQRETHWSKSRAAVCIGRDNGRAEEMLPLAEARRMTQWAGEELNTEHCARHAVQGP